MHLCRALAATLLAAACTARAPAPPARPADSLELAVRSDVTGFFPNPPIVSEGFTIGINRGIFDSLVRFDDHLQIRPALAQRWENPDDRTYVFELREGLRFSDGRPLTARDVAASFTQTLSKDWVTSDYLQAVESARALDERRVEVRTRHPYLGLLTRLPWGFVIPADGLDRQPVPALGSGPYRLESWSPGREFVLSRNPHHWGAPPAYARARFRVVPDDAQRLALLERGQTDVVDAVPLREVARLQRNPDLKVVVRSGLRVIFLCLRADRPPFSDPRVREAVDLALDRPALIERAMSGRAEPASQLVPASIVGHDPHLAGTVRDLDRARQLLAQAGLASGFEVRLDGPSNRYVNDQAVLAEVARQLAEVGIRVRVNALDKAEFFALIESQASDFHLLGFACESGDAGDVLGSLLHSPAPGGVGRFNTLGLRDRELDALIDAASESRTNQERQTRLQRAMGRVAELRVTLPLLIQVEALAHSRRVEWEPWVDLGLLPERMRPAAP
jgi:peptide/nickel transport system substrate-binding protein